ncbi:FKBP-type peptidyl-prolyl cis-trans isomerase [Luteolibacter soli]|uniref:Peptidyl-prolyl cis-trans isomerase n=1 Tax=Luteolibacter soli TaxID=3135280 RepID=A0ABU9B132_9BACT
MKSFFPLLCSVTALGLAACNSKTGSTPPPAAGESKPDAGGMTRTASGLKYAVLKKGTGKVHPKSTDEVTVHYHGTLLNGTVFDSSVDRGQPATFPLNRVIPGWTEGVQLMVVGDKFKFEIPANLAYGANSPSPAIPPNSTLVFEVELLGIK